MSHCGDHARDLIKQILSPPLGAILSSISPASFFLYFDHVAHEVRFVGLNQSSHPDPRAAEQIRAALNKESIFKGGDFEHMHAHLFRVILHLLDRGDLSLEQLYGAAIHWLQSEGLPLGDVVATREGPQKVPHWKGNDKQRPLLRFQDAIDWARLFGCNLKDMREVREDLWGYENLGDTILRVPRTATRTDLITRANAHIFLAEHLISLDPKSLRRSSVKERINSSLTFYCLPLRGVGQWRAGLTWIECEPPDASERGLTELASTLRGQASRLAKSMFEELFTSLLLSCFGILVREALALLPVSERDYIDRLSEAFSLLWWSDEIFFLKKGKPVQCLQRDSGGTLRPAPAPRPPSAHPSEWSSGKNEGNEGFLSLARDGDPLVTYIKLDFKSLASTHRDEREILERDWPFDEVHYRCYLFQENYLEIQRWADQLERLLEKIIKEQYLRLKSLSNEEMKAYEGSAHLLKGSISITGYKGALADLQEEYPDAQQIPHVIRKAENSLSLFSILEGSAGLLRVVGILKRSEHEKLTHWFSRDSLRQWDRGEVLDEYMTSITHLVRSIGGAMGRPGLDIKINDGEFQQYREDLRFDPTLLSFPPLSRARNDEPVFAILPALIEPLVNALTYLSDEADAVDEEDEQEPIKIVVRDCRRSPGLAAPSKHRRAPSKVRPTPPHILVQIGNRCLRDLNGEPSGVRTTRGLVARTRLATIGESWYDGSYWWTTVRLHPKELYNHIKAYQKSSKKASWL